MIKGKFYTNSTPCFHHLIHLKGSSVSVHREFLHFYYISIIFSCKGILYLYSILLVGLPRWLSGKEFTANVGDAGDVGLIPGSGRYPGGRNDNSL